MAARPDARPGRSCPSRAAIRPAPAAAWFYRLRWRRSRRPLRGGRRRARLRAPPAPGRRRPRVPPRATARPRWHHSRDCLFAQIGGDDPWVVAHDARRPLGNAPAVVEDQLAIGYFHHQPDIVLNQEDRGSGVADSPDEPDQLSPLGAGETRPATPPTPPHPAHGPAH